MITPASDGPLGPALLEVVRGTPSAEELAALTALFTALAAAAAEAGAGPTRAVRTAGWRRPEAFPPLSWRAAGHPGGS
ncbi:acyl-CoA carboxylase epsilon subunit [Streptomyces sp. NPDC046887]|uniref:acyl-CoA carboxylase epsilon subunit n=1 Tax=Streptomyces sp. NPDC046887 TaxID=3155472 RepID=UPI003409636F